MRPTELKSEHQAGRLAKAAYIDAMFEQHRVLADYASLIKGTDIAEITVSDGLLRFRTRQDGIVLLAERADKRIAPFEILNFDAYEKEESELLLSLIQPAWTVLDIGANIGWYSLCIAKRQPTAKVWAFEPLGPTYQALCRNLQANQAQAVRPFQLGFAEKAQTLSFYYDPDFSSKTSAADLGVTPTASTVQAQVERLDDFVAREGVGKVDFIKCDVEGAELFVYRGALELLKRDKPVVFSEMLRKWAAKFSYHPNDIVALFKSLGYSCFAVRGNGLRALDAVEESTVETNFVFLHPAAHAPLMAAHA